MSLWVRSRRDRLRRTSKSTLGESLLCPCALAAPGSPFKGPADEPTDPTVGARLTTRVVGNSSGPGVRPVGRRPRPSFCTTVLLYIRFSSSCRSRSLALPGRLRGGEGIEGTHREGTHREGTQRRRLASAGPSTGMNRSVELHGDLGFELLVGRADEVLIDDEGQASDFRTSILCFFTVTCNPPQRRTGAATTGPTAPNREEEPFPVFSLLKVWGRAARTSQKQAVPAPLPYARRRRHGHVRWVFRLAPSSTSRSDFEPLASGRAVDGSHGHTDGTAVDAATPSMSIVEKREHGQIEPCVLCAGSSCPRLPSRTGPSRERQQRTVATNAFKYFLSRLNPGADDVPSGKEAYWPRRWVRNDPAFDAAGSQWKTRKLPPVGRGRSVLRRFPSGLLNRVDAFLQ